MNTSVKLKRKYWQQFINACKSQWECGGDRYALATDKEWTDLVCEAVGDKWIMGNIIKYIGEIINSDKPQEVNYFKISVYAFIAWLKQMDKGFSHIDKGEEF